ncbi:MAG: asparagine synthase (glutamine-hydrolyzing) [Bacteroidota bacterium]
MCGINVILSKKEGSLKEPITAMQKANGFRGPDASNVLVHMGENWNIAAGVNRLKVIDQDEASNQPMISDCGNYWLSFNGEVYNYQDLKNRLSQKVEFKTKSDTEVILYWLKEYGLKGIDDLKGMFALVFIDIRNQNTIVARDKHGIIPLFYYKSDSEIIISSSIPAIEDTKLASLSLNEQAVNEYLAFRHVMAIRTFYYEVQSVGPGEILEFNEELKTSQYLITANQDEDTRTLKEVLVDSLSLINESYKKPGILLSGGVDSTLLLALLNKELGEREIKTYTLDTGPDTRWARKAANQYGAHHHEILVSIEVLNRVDEYLDKADQPIGDHGAFASWLVAEQAAQNGNVLLSGAGADELFGGYNRHRAFQFYLKNKNALLMYRHFAERSGTGAILPKNVKAIINNVENSPHDTYLNFLQNYAVNKFSQSEEIHLAADYIIDDLSSALKFDRNNYLVNDVLAITNNASMQHNVETRVPYLYDDVVAYATTISSEEKMKNKGKAPLKNLLSLYGGKQYAQRTKMGFGLPVDKWLRDKSTNWLWDSLDDDNPVYKYVSKPRLLEMLRLHRAGKVDYHMQLWSILVLAKWFERKL